jgi:toxin ParE1/3/4
VRVNFSPIVKEQMRETYRFIALDNPTRAETFTIELIDCAYDIGNHPLRYAPLVGFLNIRKRSYKGYIILYEIVDENINILHILNSVRDYTNLLNTKPRKHP